MKTCFKCKETKSLNDFYKHNRMSDGHVNKCKECNKKDNNNNRKEKIDYYLEYDRKRANLPHRVEARYEYSKTKRGIEVGNKAKIKWGEKNPIKKGASELVVKAVRDGRLQKPSECSECGKTGRIHGHHDDYAYPLTVRWLCAKCHREWHKLNGEALNG